MTSFEETLKPYIDPRWTFNMTIGIGPGWHQLVLDAHAKLVEIDPDYKITQIKEKFGGLRYYTRFENTFWSVAEPIIREAEALADKTCEECGTQESVSTKSLGEGSFWIVTLCASCRATKYAEHLARKAKYDALIAGEDDGT